MIELLLPAWLVVFSLYPTLEPEGMRFEGLFMSDGCTDGREGLFPTGMKLFGEGVETKAIYRSWFRVVRPLIMEP